MDKKYRIPIAFCMAAVWIFFIYRTVGIFFETNDDRLITEILSGSMTGVPEAHTYYVGCFLGLLISSLYRLTCVVPWYGGMLVLFQFTCCFLTADAFLSRCRHKKDCFFAFTFILLLYAVSFYVIAGIQFTSTAAMLAVTGYLCFLLYPGGRSRCILFFLMEFLSFELRSDAMLMIQPMGFIVLAGLCFIHQKPYLFFGFLPESCSATPSESPSRFFTRCGKWLRKYHPLLNAGIILLLVLIIGKGSHYIFYSSPEWKEYEKINDAVTEITDYAAIPDYAEVQDILSKYNVTQKQYNAFLQYAMIEENLSGDCLLEVASVAHEKNLPPSFSLVFKQFLASYASREHWGLNLMLIASWAAVILLVLSRKAFGLFIPLAGLLLSRSALWLFLLYEGRFPPRVMVPLYLGEIFFLFCLFFRTILQEQSAERDASQAQHQSSESAVFLRQYFPILLIILLLPFAAKTLKNQYLYLSEKNTGESIYFTGMQDMISYCNNQPEKRYFIDASTLIYYRGSAFETKTYGRRNGVITGCWYSGAPVLYQYEKDYFAGCSTICLITSSDMEMQSAMVIDYLEERLETTAYLEDTFTVSNGGKYLVYAFSF